MTTDSPIAGVREGERRKQRAFSVLDAHREVIIRQAQRALLTVLLDRGIATIDDVREIVPIPAEINPVCMGVVPGELAERGIIAADGWAKSTRPEAHARPVQVWRLVNREAALAWLTSRPALPLHFVADLFTTNKKPGDVSASSGLQKGI